MTNLACNHKKYKSFRFLFRIGAATLFLVLSVALMAALSGVVEGRQENFIKVVFRFDDFSATSDTDLERRVLEAFIHRRLPCTFAVIPYRTAERQRYESRPSHLKGLPFFKADILREGIREKILEVAQHGYTHKWIGTRGEFRGLSYDDQEKRISAGKTFLERTLGVRISTFVPPWGGYDVSTVRALENLGFEYLSAGMFGDAPYSTKLLFLPMTCNLLDLKSAVKSARTIGDSNAIIVAVFHNYDFFENNPEKSLLHFQDFENLLDWVTSQEDLRVLTLAQAAREDQDLGPQRLTANSTFPLSGHLVPPHWRSRVYFSSQAIPRARMQRWPSALLICLAIPALLGVITFYGSALVFSRLPRTALLFRYGIVALLLPFSAYLFDFFDITFTYKRFFCFLILVGMGIGAWSWNFTIKNEHTFRRPKELL